MDAMRICIRKIDFFVCVLKNKAFYMYPIIWPAICRGENGIFSKLNQHTGCAANGTTPFAIFKLANNYTIINCWNAHANVIVQWFFYGIGFGHSINAQREQQTCLRIKNTSCFCHIPNWLSILLERVIDWIFGGPSPRTWCQHIVYYHTATREEAKNKTQFTSVAKLNNKTKGNVCRRMGLVAFRRTNKLLKWKGNRM